MPTTFFILAGEASGDHHGAKLIRELKSREPGLRVVGMGGPKMAAAGLDVAKDLDGMQVVGFWEVVKQYGFFKQVFYALLDRVKQERPAALICIDYPGFNMRFAKEVRKLGIPVFYYIVPQVWAWKEKRAQAMKEYVDKAFCVFDFEPPFFEKFGLKTEFVGHPLMDDADPGALLEASGLKAPEGMRNVAFLPGSRGNEIRHLATPLAQAFHVGGFAGKNIRGLMSFPKGSSNFDLLNAHTGMASGRGFVEFHAPSCITIADKTMSAPTVLLSSLDGKAAPARVPLEGPHSALLPRLADFSVVKSGTSTLEAGLSGNPLCVVYKASAISYALAHLMVNIPVFSLVNIVLGKYAVPELLQNDVNPQRIAAEIQRGLFDEKYREQQHRDLAELPKKLGGPGASARAAQGILDFIRGKK